MVLPLSDRPVAILSLRSSNVSLSSISRRSIEKGSPKKCSPGRVENAQLVARLCHCRAHAHVVAAARIGESVHLGAEKIFQTPLRFDDFTAQLGVRHIGQPRMRQGMRTKPDAMAAHLEDLLLVQQSPAGKARGLVPGIGAPNAIGDQEDGWFQMKLTEIGKYVEVEILIAVVKCEPGAVFIRRLPGRKAETIAMIVSTMTSGRGIVWARCGISHAFDPADRKCYEMTAPVPDSRLIDEETPG